MSKTNTIAHSLHDVGLAAWFGGSLMGALGLNAAAAAVPDERQRLPVASEGWDRWTPVNAAAIAAHLLGGAGLTLGNRGRLVAQQGVASSSWLKVVGTALALGCTGSARLLGKRMEAAGPTPAPGVTEADERAPEDLAGAMRAQRVVQWLVPLTTGALLVLGSVMSEQQRPQRALAGVAQRLGMG